MVTGVDLSQTAIDLARQNFELARRRPPASCASPTARRCRIADASFDVVYGHGVLQYTADAPRARRASATACSGRAAEAIFMVYNRVSWLNALSKVMKVALEHEDAPVLRKYSIAEFRALLAPFRRVRIVPERFPVKSRLHGGWKGVAFNTLFVGTFNALPRAWCVRWAGT